MDQAIVKGVLIQRAIRDDKEFHFQRWVTDRLTDAGIDHDEAGRNGYPDITLVHSPEGIEVKGLAYPGRYADFDGNSQVPMPSKNGRAVFYAFGRYPKQPDGDEYPVHDLVIMPGSFLNADDSYVHDNKSVKAFGSYGDIHLRDRKMYIAPTPMGLLQGVEGTRTLLMSADLDLSKDGFVEVGEITRVEVDQKMSGYSFDFDTNTLKPDFIPNPRAGTEHHFRAWRVNRPGGPGEPVTLR